MSMSLSVDVSRADRLLASLHERGVHGSELRHCVHEAAHALSNHLELPWTNLRVQEILASVHPAEVMGDEIEARAVEWVVLEALGLPYDVTEWAPIAYLEFVMHYDGGAETVEEWVTAISRRRTDPEVQRRASQILAWAP